MDYKILYPEAFPIVQLELQKGETLQAESDAMVAMSPTIDVADSIILPIVFSANCSIIKIQNPFKYA